MLRGAFLALRFDLVLPFPVPHCRGQGAQARARRRAAGAVPVRADLPHDRAPRHGRCAVPDPAHLQAGLGTRQDAVRPGRPSAQRGRRKPRALGHVRGRQLQRPHEHGTGRHHRAVRGARQAPRFRRRPKPLPATRPACGKSPFVWSVRNPPWESPPSPRPSTKHSSTRSLPASPGAAAARGSPLLEARRPVAWSERGRERGDGEDQGADAREGRPRVTQKPRQSRLTGAFASWRVIISSKRDDSLTSNLDLPSVAPSEEIGSPCPACR